MSLNRATAIISMMIARPAFCVTTMKRSDSASEQAQAENVEMPADEAVVDVPAEATPAADAAATEAAPAADATAAAEAATAEAEKKM